MRIALGGLCHETNGFGNIRANTEYLANVTAVGNFIVERFGKGRSYPSGYMDEARELGVDLILTRMVYMVPSGPTQKEAFEGYRDALVADMAAAHREKPLDGIILYLHGAGLAEGYPDLEGELLRAIRAEFGPDIPISAALDLHGNISPEMVDYADFLVGVKCYPHTDEYEQGRFAMNQLCHMIKTGCRPAKKLVKLPWHVAPSAALTIEGPAHEIQQFLLAREAEDSDLICASFFHGFPYSDVSIAGAGVLVMAETQESADRNALAVARYAWNLRKEFLIPIYSAEQAVDLALSYDEADGPVVINEASDNPGGGTPADGTHLLRELLKRNVPAAFGYLCDPEVAALAAKAGVGTRISCSLGGKNLPIHGKPVELKDALVKCVSDGFFISKSPMGFGSPKRMGTTVCLVAGNVSVIVGTSRFQTMDDGPFIAGGVDWNQCRIVALKSAQHFKGWWADKVKHIVACNSPGIHSSDLTTIPFENADASYFPLQDAVWEE